MRATHNPTHSSDLPDRRLRAGLAEDKERLRWGKRVVDLLVEAKLPFGLEFVQRNLVPGLEEITRCLRGLGWTSFKKGVSDWQPARRCGRPNNRARHGVPRAGSGCRRCG